MVILRAIGALFRFVLRALDVLRKVLHLALLLIIFGAMLVASSTSLPILPHRAAPCR